MSCTVGILADYSYACHVTSYIDFVQFDTLLPLFTLDQIDVLKLGLHR